MGKSKMIKKSKRIGLIGYGYIGKIIHSMINKYKQNKMEVVFIYDIEQKYMDGVKKELILQDISQFESRNPDLILEMAHPDITRNWSDRILKKCDYMFISTTVLADKGINEKLKIVTEKYKTRAIIPHGGVIGVDALFENREILETVDITMKKPPKNVDFGKVGINPDKITEETILYDGPTRGICPLFPRNVNTHATIAYAGIGFDRTHSILVVNPEWEKATLTINAKGKGVEIHIERVEDITGVTGASSPNSIYNSLQMEASQEPGIHLY